MGAEWEGSLYVDLRRFDEIIEVGEGECGCVLRKGVRRVNIFTPLFHALTRCI